MKRKVLTLVIYLVKCKFKMFSTLIKTINKIFYIIFVIHGLSNSGSIEPLGLTIILSSPMWLVATMLDSAGLASSGHSWF
jgi:hypothetical protein